MKLTTKGKYAVTTLLDVAMHQQTGPATIAQVAHRQGLSQTYLERLAVKMRSKGLLKSIRGPKGGYILARPAHEITIAQVIAAVGESLDATSCQGQADCRRGQVCLTHALWEQLNDRVSQFLESVTLSNLVKIDADGVVLK